VAEALLDLRRRHDHLLAELADRAVGLAGDEPFRPAERARGLEREPRPALVADDHHQVGVGRRVDGVERLDGPAARQRRVVRRPAAGEDDAGALG
jgi:hypothetical protein